MPTSLAQLQADVLTLVKRPDLVNDIALHTKNAILKAHSADYFMKDLYENAFQFAAAATEYQLDTNLLVSRWRKTSYLNVVDPTTGAVIKQLKPIAPLSFVDGYGYIKDYVWYEAGQYLQIYASGQEVNFGFGAYLYPDTTLVNPSWIADMFPYAIQYEAARTLFKSIGFDEQSAAMERLVAEAMAEVRMTGLATVGE